MAFVGSASADVARYQTQSMTITTVQPKDEFSQWKDVWTHTYNVTLNPCNNTFTGTGSVFGTASTNDPRGFLTNETITGTLNGSSINYTAAGTGPNSGWPADFSYSFTGALGVQGPGTDSLGDTNLEFRVNATPTSTSKYKNHGDYVSSQGGGSDAAHSCIGMPIH